MLRAMRGWRAMRQRGPAPLALSVLVDDVLRQKRGGRCVGGGEPEIIS